MNSILNPEAPEFHPHITSFTQEAYTSLNKTIRLSNSFPSGSSYDFFKTFSDFNLVTSQLSESVVKQSNKIIITEVPRVKLEQKDLKYNTEIIVDSNDRMLDRIEINIDTLNKGNTVNDQQLDGTKPGPSSMSSWKNDLEITKIQLGSTTFIGAKNIPRPQLSFKDPIDNSNNLWVPKISDKPNNIKPLALMITYNENGEAVGYEHPYKVELELYEPPQQFLEPDTEPPRFPPAMEDTKYTYIDTQSQVDELVEHLSTVKEIAVDLEHHSYRTYQGITCLIQISTDEGGDFIIDALAVREHLHKLNLSFTDPRKVKVFHGAEMDVLWLQRDFGVYIVGLFDTYQAARTLLMHGLSLKHLLKKYCDIDADKKYQLADWRMRPLPSELVRYARQDTHCLLYVWRRMRAELLAAARGSSQLLRAVFASSRLTCAATYKKPVVDDTSHLPLYVRSQSTFDARQMTALRMLYKWRDAQARLLDESTSYLLPNHMLLSLAATLPREVQGVTACCNPTPPFVKQNLITIHRMMLSCRELPMEPLSGEPFASSAVSQPFRRSRKLAYDVHDLTDFPRLTPVDEAANLNKTNKFINEVNDREPQIPAMIPDEEKKPVFISNLNVDAQMYIPPYYRYRGYRFLIKEQEIKQIEDKEAKVAAIAHGDPLIKAEVLDKLEVTKKLVNEADANVEKCIQRKRKRSTDEGELKFEKNAQHRNTSQRTSNSDTHNAKSNKNVKPFNYKQANYKKFQDDREQTPKQAKMKFKKSNK